MQNSFNMSEHEERVKQSQDIAVCSSRETSVKTSILNCLTDVLRMDLGLRAKSATNQPHPKGRRG